MIYLWGKLRRKPLTNAEHLLQKHPLLPNQFAASCCVGGQGNSGVDSDRGESGSCISLTFSLSWRVCSQLILTPKQTAFGGISHVQHPSLKALIMKNVFI